MQGSFKAFHLLKQKIKKIKKINIYFPQKCEIQLKRSSQPIPCLGRFEKIRVE
jgi:hypothetical protein